MIEVDMVRTEWAWDAYRTDRILDECTNNDGCVYWPSIHAAFIAAFYI